MNEYKAIICSVEAKEVKFLESLMDAIATRAKTILVCYEPVGNPMSETEQGYALTMYDRKSEEIVYWTAYCDGWMDRVRKEEEIVGEI